MKKNIFKILILIAIIFSIVLLIIGIVRLHIIEDSDGYIFNANEIELVNDCENIVVLGARVYNDGKMSIILKERAMATVDLYAIGKVCKIIISGVDEEVYAVQKYLTDNNVSKDIIFLDVLGIDTFTSMRNVRDIYEVDKLVIVTQDFHLPRAVYIARNLGIDASGFVAYKYPYQNKFEEYKYFMRELLAGVKAVWQSEIIKN